MKVTRSFSRPQRHAGFSLIEVLVAIVVLAIGVLGVAALQTTSLRQGQGSMQATQAMALAYDYADRIRANPCGAYQGLYEMEQSSLPSSSSPPTACTSSSASCNASDLAAWDRYDWYVNHLQKELPANSTAIVRCADTIAGGGTQHCASSNYTTCGMTPSPPQPITIYVFWDQSRTASSTPIANRLHCGTDPSHYNPSTDLACVTLSVQP
jgi:type IV pilus assembly protein PilV